MRGRKVFEQTLVPLHDGTSTVPAVTLTAFDPGKAAYVARASEPITIQVAPGAAPAPPAASATTAPSAAAPAQVTPAASSAEAVRSALARVPFAIVVGGGLVAVLAAVAAFVLRRTTRARVELATKRRMRRAAVRGSAPTFFAAARDLIRARLARAWNVAEEEVTTRAIVERLGQAGAPLADALALDAAVRFGGALEHRDLRARCAAIEHALAVA
jgi:hypothetical protein